jgi:DNA-binding response OmpR family regulator
MVHEAPDEDARCRPAEGRAGYLPERYVEVDCRSDGAEHSTGEEVVTLQRAILLVDDDADLVELYEMYLTMHGHDVTIAHDGMHALELLADGWAPDVCLLDVRMPDIDGFDLVRMVRARGLRFPICLYTAYDTDEALRTASELDVQDLLFKPSPPSVVLARLELAMAATEAAPPG